MVQTFQTISSGNLDKMSIGISKALITTICGNPHWMYIISFQYYGGILWNRPNHYDFIFNKIKNLKQIFGHTIHEHPWIEGENYCIDTNSQHYDIIENKKITICETSKIK